MAGSCNPSDPFTPFMPYNMYPTRDGRRISTTNIYPALRSRALNFSRPAMTPVQLQRL